MDPWSAGRRLRICGSAREDGQRRFIQSEIICSDAQWAPGGQPHRGGADADRDSSEMHASYRGASAKSFPAPRLDEV